MRYVQIFMIIMAFGLSACGKESIVQNGNLSEAEKAVVFGKATERPFSGKYDKFFDGGIYTCKVCTAPLYKSKSKFDAGCGWPAFDDSFPNAVRETPDSDGNRTEITCARCGAHLGHIFRGENLTKKNVRHCVNSLSMNFIPSEYIGVAIVAGGCFWGIEENMRHLDGVISSESGYCGGSVKNPTYREVCSGKTGHRECVEVLFDKRKTSYEKVLKRFFESHDFTQKDGQGPDIGEQYKSAIFCLDAEQYAAAKKLADELGSKGYDVATSIIDFSGKVKKADGTFESGFYSAEEYHQRFFERNGGMSSCGKIRKIFNDR